MAIGTKIMEVYGTMSASNYVMGLDHVGIPTMDMEATIAFFTALGFTIKYETMNGSSRVLFLECSGVTIETYEVEKAAGVRGAIDHLALKVSDLDRALEEVQKTGYPVIEGPCFLNFWDNGVRYFMVQGPNGEVVEFAQTL